MPLKFPPLHTLSLFVDSDPAWLTIIQACRETLRSLTIRVQDVPDRLFPLRLVLPKLQCLNIQNYAALSSIWPLDLVTPLLNTYIEEHLYENYGKNLHTHTASVRYLRVDRKTTPLLTPKLVLIQLEQESQAINIILRLFMDDSKCRDLQVIELLQPCGAPYLEGMLMEINETQNRSIGLTVGSDRATHLPGTLSKAKVNDDIHTYPI